MITFLLRGWHVLLAVLAELAEMLRSALPAIHWEAEGKSHLPALLGRGTFVSEGPGKPIELSLEAAFTGHPMTFCEMARHEGFLAPASNEYSGVGICIAPLMVTGLLGRMPLPLLSPGRLNFTRSAR